jgi:hypothetical protein
MLDPETTLAIILGVSECPRAPDLQPLPQCANSAKDFENYLLTSLRMQRSNIINLFDSKAAASDQLDRIEDWLSHAVAEETKPTDLFVYYSGHGGFTRNDQAYFLAVERTRAGSEGATSIRYIDLASSIKRHANALRKYLVLDCCFAASAVVKMQSNLNQMVVQRIEDELPPSGTAVLCSSSAKLVSIAPKGQRHTMFSGALLQCLKEGVQGGTRALTLEDVGNRAREIICEKFPNDSVRPELHVPEQYKGNPAKVPLFPNVLWVKPDPLERIFSELSTAKPREDLPQERKTDGKASAISAWQRSLQAEVWIGICSGFSAAMLARFMPFPFGTSGTKESFFPPLTPALCLAAALIVLARINRKQLGVMSAAKLSIAVLSAWFIAWDIVYFAVVSYIDKTGAGFTESLIISSLVAGFIGAFVLALSARLLLHGFRNFYRRDAIGLAISALPFALLGVFPILTGVAFKGGLLSLPFNLALFITWHTFCVAMFEWAPDSSVSRNINDADSVHSRDFKIRTPFRSNLIAAMLLAATFSASMDFLPLVAMRWLMDAPVAFSVDEGSSTETTKSQRQISVKYQIASTGTDYLTCKLELRMGDKIFQAEATNPDDGIYKTISRKTSTFSVSAENAEQSANVRLECSGPRTSYTSDWTYVYISSS